MHRALTPKLNILRSFRVEARAASYVHSSLRKYLEEALAESFAQVAIHGVRGLLTGIAFPVRNGYVTLFVKQVTHHGILKPVVPEAAGLYLGSLNVNSWLWDMHFSPRRPD